MTMRTDVGWIVSMESYYTSQVQYIFDTVIQNLMEHRDRKFIIVEVYEQAMSARMGEQTLLALGSLSEGVQ